MRGPIDATKHFKRDFSQSLPALVAGDKKLAKVNLTFLFVVERVGYGVVIQRKDHRFVLVAQPCRHAFTKLWDRHGIPMPFIANELMIPQG